MSQQIGHVYQSVSEAKRRSIQWVMTSDTIATSTWTVRPTGMVVDGYGTTDDTTTIQLTGGVAGVTYTAENQILTVGTQKHKRHFDVTVEG